jgi:hypothetical protein
MVDRSSTLPVAESGLDGSRVEEEDRDVQRLPNVFRGDACSRLEGPYQLKFFDLLIFLAL